MTLITKKLKMRLLIMIASIAFLSSCNKDLEQFPNNSQPVVTDSLFANLNITPNDSLFRRLVIKAGLQAAFSNPASAFTLFVADNTVIKPLLIAVSAGTLNGTSTNAQFSTFITAALPAANAAAIVNYHTIPQKWTTAQFIHPFPNLELPTAYIAVPGNPLARLRAYVSKNPSTGLFYFNNIPLAATDLVVGNSVIHHLAAIGGPPSRYVWDRINTDADLTFFKAAVQRADSGLAVGSSASLAAGLANFGANWTVFAPSNLAVKTLLIGMGLPAGQPDAFYIGFISASPLFSTLTAKGLVVYHLLGKRVAPLPTAPMDSLIAGIRVFSVNVPTTPIAVRTFLNSPGPGYFHPGVILQATFAGPSAATFTVKGLVNATPSNVAINPTPDPGGTSDQHFINGVLHKIDQVLRPQ